jgi:hypothetical protein
MRLIGPLALLLLLAIAPAAHAQSVVARAAEALAGDPVYVDPKAERAITEADADRIRQRIDERGAGPMYVAILPDAAKREGGGSATGVAQAIEQRLGRPGTYAVVAGTSFRAGSTDVRGTGEQASAALDELGSQGVAATLLGFVDRMGELRAGRSPESGGGSGGGGGGGGSGVGVALLLPLLALGAGAMLLSRRRRRKQDDAELAELKENVRDDLVALGDDIRALDLDVEMPGVDPVAKADYDRAVEAYDRADTILDRARQPEDFEPIGAALEEGRFAMASAKARMAGRAVPERTPPCFFDPRHGPSDREVEWAPPDGAPRLVPACEADAQRVERGQDPQAREVMVGGQRMPYWNAGPMYAPFAGGYFGGFGGGLFPGLMMGTLLGSAMGGFGGLGGFGVPVAYGDGGDGGDWGGGDFGGGGGGFGGGGGDFGGGGFGGGGGDFGGGDF